MSRKLTQEEFEKRILEIGEGKYIPKSKYVNNKEKVTILHLECNEPYKVTPVHFFRGRKCPNCAKNKKKTTKSFTKEVLELGEGNYELIGEYNGNHKHCTIKHLECNRTYPVTPANFVSGYRCPLCSHNKKKDTETFKKEVSDLTNGEYLLKGEYKNNKIKTSILHKKCNKTFPMRPNDFISGHRCPHCATLPHQSLGIQGIKEWLEGKEYYYKEEFSFADCKYKNRLLFDFCLFDEDNNPIILIEYDGKQHFMPSFGDQKKFEEQQIRDKIKDDYCKNNNLTLIRISYKQLDTINEILEENIK